MKKKPNMAVPIEVGLRNPIDEKGENWSEGVAQRAKEGVYVPNGTPTVMRAGVALLQDAIIEMREVRESGSWSKDGAHSFREWCVMKFGENLGCWLDSML